MEAAINPAPSFQQAMHAEQNGEFSRALELHRACLSDPGEDLGTVLFHCGWCLENLQGPESQEALSYYERAASCGQSPSLKANSYFRSGWILMHQKSLVAAAEMFQHAVRQTEAGGSDGTYEHAVFWYAVCLENQGRYIEAIARYRQAGTISSALDPECRLRELQCLNQIGSYGEALAVCLTFEGEVPVGFPEARYRDLAAVALRERRMLEECLGVTGRPTKESKDAIR